MTLTEKHHAFLIGCYYRALKESFGDEGIDTFVEATKRYAEERGRRMALRAEKHGLEKNYRTYFSHGEWEATDPDLFNALEGPGENGDLTTQVYKCPWNTTFREMDLLECGDVYCTYIDRHIVKGFNPELKLDVTSLIHSSDKCMFYWRQANLDETDVRWIAEMKARYRNENLMPFDYHTGHVYRTFRLTILERFDSRGDEVVNRAATCFREAFGGEVLHAVLKYRDTDFGRLPGDSV